MSITLRIEQYEYRQQQGRFQKYLHALPLLKMLLHVITHKASDGDWRLKLL